ncbi:anhydro-N-acetylmuramic acid kinase AnmK [Haploplasma axanthum]|nr:anhydro-N-acetylmuramic acid kinase AnmK [Haploplasma axanthum]
MKKIGVGIMSGTSLDGIDVAVVEINHYKENTKITTIACETILFDSEVINKIKDVIDLEKSNVQKITSLNYELAIVFSNAVIETFNKNNLDIKNIDFVASHGQTIWHQPKNENGFVKSTLQIGEGAILADRLKTTVVSNFRAADIAAGGEGAPLVSYVDKLLFYDKNKNIALHNLGGISNLTLLAKNDLVAYDTGPANMMIDYAMKKLFNQDYDYKGLCASKGNLIPEMYEEIMNLNYFKCPYPKTTGRELFGDKYTELLVNKYSKHDRYDIINTLTMVTINSVANEYKKLIDKYGRLDEIIFSGGGAHNEFVILNIKKRLVNARVSLIDEYGISSDYKEAIAFAILGNETLHKFPSNDIKATGAKKRSILGQINYYYEE